MVSHGRVRVEGAEFEGKKTELLPITTTAWSIWSFYQCRCERVTFQDHTKDESITSSEKPKIYAADET